MQSGVDLDSASAEVEATIEAERDAIERLIWRYCCFFVLAITLATSTMYLIGGVEDFHGGTLWGLAAMPYATLAWVVGARLKRRSWISPVIVVLDLCVASLPFNAIVQM